MKRKIFGLSIGTIIMLGVAYWAIFTEGGKSFVNGLMGKNPDGTKKV